MAFEPIASRDRIEAERAMCRLMSPIVSLTVAVTLGFTSVSGAAADSVAEFYAGKSIALLIGFGPGGGYDAYARVLARHLGKHIPGNPLIVPQNMPGAG
jgi:tripartite-type tricarboxylate transporter receptor subunit TctC